MQMTEEQIYAEFKRQVELCCGIGQAAQEAIVEEFWSREDSRTIAFDKAEEALRTEAQSLRRKIAEDL